MSEIITARRGFLRGLISLPLIGGGVTLIGQPTAAAVPVTVELLDRYRAFLLAEAAEAAAEADLLRNPGHPYIVDQRREWCKELHWYDGAKKRQDIMALVRGSSPGTRAAVVLGASGCQP